MELCVVQQGDLNASAVLQTLLATVVSQGTLSGCRSIQAELIVPEGA